MPETPLSVDVVAPVVPVPPTLPAAFVPTLASTAGPLAVLLAPVDIPVEVSVPADMPNDESVPVVGVVLVELEPRCERRVECVLRAARLVVALSLDVSGSLETVALVELEPVVLGPVVLGPVVLGRV